MASSRFSLEDYAGVAVVTFADSAILETSLIEQLGRDLYDLPAGQGKKKLVLDFSNVKILSSHMLGVLLTLHGKVREVKGRIVLCGLRPELKKVFTITSLDKMFDFYTDDAAALASFSIRTS
ncbi:MAG: STAS domain-containing protein [Phycisphaerae bacterium]|nr:STAS domain-containing protein [Phycisphaerae bacterium]